MSRRDMLDAVVVGAGVVGAATALALARDGLQVALVEAREPPRWQAAEPDLRVYAFAHDNAALLDSLGVWSQVTAARIQPYRAMRVRDAGGGGELVFDADAFARRELGWIVEHALLVDRLWAALPAAGVRLHCPARVTDLQADPDADSVTLELSDGSRLRARVAVAADGGDSALRTLAGIEVDARDYGQRGLVAFVDTERPHDATCRQRFLPTGPLAFLPFTGGPVEGHRSSIVWTLPDAEGARLQALEPEAFMRELGNAFAGGLGDVRGVSARAAFPLRRQLARSQAVGRVVVVGDAAHVVHPLAGQGVNLGLRDVATLRAVLAAPGAVDARGLPVRLQRWARERRSENTLAAHGFDAVNRAFSNDALLPTLLRGPLMGLGSRVPGLSHALWRRASGG